MDIRIGNGIDFHKLKAGENLVLGGIEINSPIGTVAYSDGDVLIHALVDSILGALSLGDLGTYFPTGDKRWKNADSMLFLTFANNKINELGYRLLNADITMILQSPSICEYRNKIINNIATKLNVNSNQISFKATTTDHLGFIGKKEGIASFVSTLLIRNEN